MYNLSTKILIVDDLMTMRKLVKKGLESIGFSLFEEAENGEAAWTILKNNPEIGLIISDSQMPKCTGIDFLKMIRTDQKFKDLPFILLTSSSEFSQIKRAQTAGVDNCIVKPFTTQSLKEKLNLTYQKKAA
jgi:two-component system, chemotaxis family, chemotaxis protein CheY